MAFAQLYESFRGGSLPMCGQQVAQFTGVIGVSLASGASIFTYRYPEAATRVLAIQRWRVFTTFITATTAVEAGRALRLVRGTNDAPGTANPTGGNAGNVVRKDSTNTSETLGVARFADTSALTTTGFTFETGHLGLLPLIPIKSISAIDQNTFLFDGNESDPVFLRPGQLVAVQASQAFPAAGTFQLYVELHAVEL